MRNEPVGILGGIGPMATVYFMRRVLDLTDYASRLPVNGASDVR